MTRSSALRCATSFASRSSVALVEDPLHVRPRQHRDHRGGERDDDSGEPVAAHEPGHALPARVAVRRDELAGEEPPHVLGERAGVRVASRRARTRAPCSTIARSSRGTPGARARDRRDRVASASTAITSVALVRRDAAARRRAGGTASRRARRRRRARPSSSPRACSGAMKPGVPNTEPACVSQRSPATAARLAAARDGVVLADDLREPPVDHDGLAELADEDVRRLEVAVDARRGGARARPRRRGEHVRQQREPLAEVGRARDQLVERPPGHLAHDVERPAVGASCPRRRAARSTGARAAR